MNNKIKNILIFLFLATFSCPVVWARPYAYYRVIVERNIFKPLWQVQNTSKNNELELEKARLEEEKRQAELKKEEERKQLESKKRELENSFSLSGVVFDGKKTYALITNRQSNQGGAYLEGDLLKEAKIVSIDEKTQTVELNYENKFSVTLRINNSR